MLHANKKPASQVGGGLEIGVMLSLVNTYACALCALINSSICLVASSLVIP